MKNKTTVKLPDRITLREILISTAGLRDKWERKSLILEAIKRCGYSAEELKDTSCESVNTKLKSFSGIVINELISEKIIETDEQNLHFLARKKPLEKKEIVDAFLKKYLTEDEKKDNSPSGKKNTIKAVLGNLIKKREAEIYKAVDSFAFIEKELLKNESVAAIVSEAMRNYPDSPLGSLLKECYKKYTQCKKGKLETEAYKKFIDNAIIECISFAGGEFFEQLSLTLLTKSYGDNVVSNKLTGGPTDNGIDGILQIRDDLGFVETVFFQAKTKRKATANISLNDIREFVGVMTAEKADKGILISNSNFHRETVKFSAKVPKLMLINKEKLCSMMLETKTGLLIDKDNVPYIDEEIFL